MQWILLRVRNSTFWKAIAAFALSQWYYHTKARNEADPTEALKYRSIAEDDAAAEKEFMNAARGSFVTADQVNHNQGTTQSQKVTLSASGRDLLWGTVLALSLAMNVAGYYKMRDVDTRKWLHDYDLNQFQMGDFARLQREVDADHTLLSLLGPKCLNKPEK